MEMTQNVSNCHKSERSRNKKDLPYFIVVLVIIGGLPGREIEGLYFSCLLNV